MIPRETDVVVVSAGNAAVCAARSTDPLGQSKSEVAHHEPKWWAEGRSSTAVPALCGQLQGKDRLRIKRLVRRGGELTPELLQSLVATTTITINLVANRIL